MPEVDLNDIEILRKFRTVEKALNDAITEYADPSNNATDENVFNDDEIRVGVRARGIAGYGPFWLAAKGKG